MNVPFSLDGPVGSGAGLPGNIETPVINNELKTIVIGDDYLIAINRPLVFRLTTSVVVASCFLAFYKDAINKLTISGTPTDNNDGTVSLSFEIARTLTDIPFPGTPLIPGLYEYNVEMRDASGREISVIHAESFSRGLKRVPFVRKRT